MFRASASQNTCDSCVTEDIHTLKDCKTQKSKFIILTYFKFLNFIKIWQNEHQYVSKTCFKSYVKIMNNVRATVYQIAIPYDSKVAI